MQLLCPSQTLSQCWSRMCHETPGSMEVQIRSGHALFPLAKLHLLLDRLNKDGKSHPINAMLWISFDVNLEMDLSSFPWKEIEMLCVFICASMLYSCMPFGQLVYHSMGCPQGKWLCTPLASEPAAVSGSCRSDIQIISPLCAFLRLKEIHHHLQISVAKDWADWGYLYTCCVPHNSSVTIAL